MAEKKTYPSKEDILPMVEARNRDVQHQPDLYIKDENGAYILKTTLDVELPPLTLLEDLDAPQDSDQVRRPPKRKRSKFNQITPAQQEQIINKVRERLMTILKKTDDVSDKNTEGILTVPSFLVSHTRFREIVMTVLNELAIYSNSKTPSNVTRAIHDTFTTEAIMRRVVKLHTNNMENVHYAIGLDKENLEQHIGEFDALMKAVLRKIAASLENFVRENQDMDFNQNIIKRVLVREAIPNELFECVFVQLVQMGIFENRPDKYGYNFAADAAQSLEKLSNNESEYKSGTTSE